MTPATEETESDLINVELNYKEILRVKRWINSPEGEPLPSLFANNNLRFLFYGYMAMHTFRGRGIRWYGINNRKKDQVCSVCIYDTGIHEVRFMGNSDKEMLFIDKRYSTELIIRKDPDVIVDYVYSNTEKEDLFSKLDRSGYDLTTICRSLRNRGRHVLAIKYYKRCAECDLKTAKEIVNKM